jgi:hypothetical protein
VAFRYLGWCPGIESAARFLPDRDMKRYIMTFTLVLLTLLACIWTVLLNSILQNEYSRLTEVPHELFYISGALFAVLVGDAFHQALREKQRFHYIVGILCLLGLAWSIMFILGQVSLAGLFWLAAMIFSVVMLPELVAFQDRQMGEVDIQSPMRLRDFFSKTNSGWLKLAYKHGLGMTVIIYFLFIEAIAGGMLLALNLFYDLPFGLMLSVFTSGIILIASFYRQVKRGLTTIHLPSGSPTER